MFRIAARRERRFFDLFDAHAERIVADARELDELLNKIEDAQARAVRIKAIEHVGDDIVQEAIQLFHRSFITPIDRNDLHELISALDEVLDLLEDAAQTVYIFDVCSVSGSARRLGSACLVSARKLQTALALLPDMGNSKAILILCADIDQLEADADRDTREAIADLFRSARDDKELLKAWTLYEALEAVTDRCKDIARVLVRIVVTNSER